MKNYTKDEIKKIAIEKYGKDYEMFQGQIEWFIKGFNEALRIHDVVGRSEQLKAVQKLKDFAYEVCPLHREDDLEEIIGSL